MKKGKRIIIAIITAAIIIIIGTAAELQKFTEPLTILIPIILVGQMLAVGSFFLLRKKGYDWFDSFYAAVALSIFSVFPGFIAGLIEFSEETGNIGRGIFHAAEFAIIIFAVVYLISGMKSKNDMEAKTINNVKG